MADAWPVDAAPPMRCAKAKGRPTRESFCVSARTVPVSDTSIMALAPARAPWLRSTLTTVPVSLVAMAWRNAKSEERMAAPCSRRAWFCASRRWKMSSP